MIQLQRTNAENSDFISLVKILDKDLAIRDGDDHPFYAQFNKVDTIKYVIVAYDENTAVGCGAIKEYSSGTMEIKRMFTSPECRGKGIESLILQALEQWAAALGYDTCILETGTKQYEAIGLYKKNNYTLIPNYGQYAGVENSLCFEKIVGNK